MKHIRDILAQRQLSLFGNPGTEKGSREWSVFNSVVDDKIDAYPTRAPEAPRIHRGGVVRTRRFKAPHALFRKPRHAN